MKRNNTILLIAEIDKTVEQLEKINAYYEQMKSDFGNFSNSKNYDLVIKADIFTDYYTCLETVFLRVSKFFENNLDNTKWHSHLIDKMILNIPNVRKRLLRDETYKYLKEFLRFRHFKRYYFEFDYDRDRIDYLEKKYLQSYLLVLEDLNMYKIFLNKL